MPLQMVKLECTLPMFATLMLMWKINGISTLDIAQGDVGNIVKHSLETMTIFTESIPLPLTFTKEIFDIEVEVEARPQAEIRRQLRHIQDIVSRFSIIRFVTSSTRQAVDLQVGEYERQNTLDTIEEIIKLDKRIEQFQAYRNDDIVFDQEYVLKIPYPLNIATLSNTTDILTLVTKKMYDLSKLRFQCEKVLEDQKKKKEEELKASLEANNNEPSAPAETEDYDEEEDDDEETTTAPPSTGRRKRSVTSGSGTNSVTDSLDSLKAMNQANLDVTGNNIFINPIRKAKEDVDRLGYNPAYVYPDMCTRAIDERQASTVAFFYTLSIRDLLIRFTLIRNDLSRHLATLRALDARKVPDSIREKMDDVAAMEPKTAADVSATVEKCVKNINGLDCILQVTARENSGMVNILIPIPISAKNVTVQVVPDYTVPIKRPEEPTVAEAKECSWDHTGVRCPTEPIFKPDECVRAAYLKNLPNMISKCRGKKIPHNQEARPYTFHLPGQTIAISLTNQDMDFEVGNVKISNHEGLDFRHKNLLKITYGEEPSDYELFEGNTRSEDNEYRTSWLTEERREKIILGWFPKAYDANILGIIKDAYDSFIPSEDSKDIIIMVSLTLASIITLCAGGQIAIMCVRRIGRQQRRRYSMENEIRRPIYRPTTTQWQTATSKKTTSLRTKRKAPRPPYEPSAPPYESVELQILEEAPPYPDECLTPKKTYYQDEEDAEIEALAQNAELLRRLRLTYGKTMQEQQEQIKELKEENALRQATDTRAKLDGQGKSVKAVTFQLDPEVREY